MVSYVAQHDGIDTGLRMVKSWIFGLPIFSLSSRSSKTDRRLKYTSTPISCVTFTSALEPRTVDGRIVLSSGSRRMLLNL